MRVALVSRTDLSGGAARAAFRLHRFLLADGCDSRMLVGLKYSDLATVLDSPSRLGRVWDLVRPALTQALMRRRKADGDVWRSLAWLPGFLPRRVLSETPDVVNLHWIGDETLTVGEVAFLARQRPLVWTLHDMWPFCGAAHYAVEDAAAPWRDGYRNSADDRGFDIERWTWRRKARSWRDIPPIHLIAPSRWMAECAAQSALMRDWPLTVIPNPLDTDRFRPIPQSAARELMELPPKVPLLLFGRFGGGDNERKGWELLLETMQHLRGIVPAARCLIIGMDQPTSTPDLGFPVHWLGMLHDDISLALAYSAASITVVPSRQDNLPQLATEAQACGCPVAAFAVGGMADAVEHQVTGYLAHPFDTVELARGVAWMLADQERHAGLRVAARERATKLWSPAAVIPRYLETYRLASADFYAKGKA